LFVNPLFPRFDGEVVVLDLKLLLLSSPSVRVDPLPKPTGVRPTPLLLLLLLLLLIVVFVDDLDELIGMDPATTTVPLSPQATEL
jgi:hypothetical protein